MDKTTLCNLLKSYDEITIEHVTDDYICFSLFDKQFVLSFPFGEGCENSPYIFLHDDPEFNFPHVMLNELSAELTRIFHLPEGSNRWICLQESESVVNSIASLEDKVIDSIDRLIELLSMNKIEKEREFHKEFILYWNQCAVSSFPYVIFLRNENALSQMAVYYSEHSCRLIAPDIHLSDLESTDRRNQRIWVRHIECNAFYVPITDCRGILPPHLGFTWTAREIKEIVFASQVRHISPDSFQQIKTIVPTTQDLLLVFGIPELGGVVFAARIKCIYNKGRSLLEKLTEDILDVEILKTQRKDYLFLNKQIGNDLRLLDKNVLLIGAGSLGSYVASELVKNGASNIKIYDDDTLQDENVLRWAFGFFGKGSKKVATLAALLNHLHPEVMVKAIEKKIDSDMLLNELPNSDLIIFTIGSSDEQLKLNRVLHDAGCTVPVIFVWLEAGGINSHILYVNYREQGCYECLFTDDKGDLVNNRGSLMAKDAYENTIIRNGCGGTRAAYGTAILLRTTAVLLNILGKILSDEITHSMLIDISPDSVAISDTKFPEEACNCCGHRRN